MLVVAFQNINTQPLLTLNIYTTDTRNITTGFKAKRGPKKQQKPWTKRSIKMSGSDLGIFIATVISRGKLLLFRTLCSLFFQVHALHRTCVMCQNGEMSLGSIWHLKAL